MSMKLIMFINVKMPTIVGILTFMSMLNATSLIIEQQEKNFIFQHFEFSEQLKFYAQFS